MRYHYFYFYLDKTKQSVKLKINIVNYYSYCIKTLYEISLELEFTLPDLGPLISGFGNKRESCISKLHIVNFRIKQVM